MKRALFAVVALLCIAQTTLAHADIVFSNLGNVQVFDPFAYPSYSVVHNDPSRSPPNWEQALSFTAPSGFRLDTIRMPLGLTHGTPALDVSLAVDDGGKPGALLETIHYTGPFAPPFTQVPLATLDSSTHSILERDTRYWLMLSAPGPAATDISVFVSPLHETSEVQLFRSVDLGGSWICIVPCSGSQRMAFEVAGTPAAAALTVSLLGSGTGTVASDPPGIACPGVCTGMYSVGTVALAATATDGSVFTGWLGGGCTGLSTTCNVSVTAATSVTATFASPGTAIALDIDLSAPGTQYDALTDGLLIIRNLRGLSGESLINGAVGPDATRTTAAQIGDYLNDIRPVLDVDGNGQVDALTDGLLIGRYLFGLRDSALVAGAVDPLARRTNAAAIESHIRTLIGITGDTWTQKATFPPSVPFRQQISFAIGDKGYLVVPCFIGAPCATPLWEYYPQSDSWKQLGNHPGLTFQSPSFVLNGNAYVVSGNAVWQYAPVSNHWTRKGDIPGADKRAGFGFSLNGLGYIGGGFYNGGALWQYDPNSDAWTPKNDHPALQYGMNDPTVLAVDEVTFTIGDKAYVTGTNSYFWEYSPDTDTWVTRSYVNAVYGQAFAIGSRGYVFNTLGALYEYDAMGDHWTPAGAFPGQTVCYPAGFAIGGNLYVGVGGRFAGNTCNLDVVNSWWGFRP